MKIEDQSCWSCEDCLRYSVDYSVDFYCLLFMTSKQSKMVGVMNGMKGRSKNPMMLLDGFDEIRSASDSDLQRLLQISQKRNRRGRFDSRIARITAEMRRRITPKTN